MYPLYAWPNTSPHAPPMCLHMLHICPYMWPHMSPLYAWPNTSPNAPVSYVFSYAPYMSLHVASDVPQIYLLLLPENPRRLNA